MPAPPQRARFKRSWTPQEHRSFLRAMRRHGKGKWKEIAADVGSRTANQCQSHAQKYFLRQAKSDTERKKKSIHDIHDIVDDDHHRADRRDDDDDDDDHHHHHHHHKSCKPSSPTVRKPTVIAPASVLPHPALTAISQSFTSAPATLGATRIAPATFNYAALLPQFLTPGMPDPSRATIVAPPPAPRVRVTVHVNGQAKGGMALLVPDTLEQFFETAATKLKTELVFKRIFTRSGGEITSVDELCQDDMLWLSSGQDFLTPK
ncbi:Myb-like DNA-binding protein [Gracilaria domingensis]|nr:Myb-like DNA-binding protein [Gracilaria domingensis]